MPSMLTAPRLTPAQIEGRLDQILLKVQKPGRYVGGELNSVVKDWDKVAAKVAFVFPDIYDIGVSNVGLKILYDQVNQREDALAERAYAPWLDMEALMREHGIPLYTLESKRPLADFDIIGFSLPYETLYTNTLNVLDLAGIPVRSEDRDETHPIIIAGGHSTMNPEPMHAFIDAFVIGEGEEVIHDIINVVMSLRGAQRRSNLNVNGNGEIASTPALAGGARNDILRNLPKSRVCTFLVSTRQPISKMGPSHTSSLQFPMFPELSPSVSSRSCLPHRRNLSSRTLTWSTTASRSRSCVDARAAAVSVMQG